MYIYCKFLKYTYLYIIFLDVYSIRAFPPVPSRPATMDDCAAVALEHMEPDGLPMLPFPPHQVHTGPGWTRAPALLTDALEFPHPHPPYTFHRT